RQCCRLIVGQHVNRSTNCQVHQEQAIAQWSSVQREIIPPHLCRRLTHTELLVPQQTAQGIRTGWQSRGSRESGPSFTTSSLGQRNDGGRRLLRSVGIK